MQAESLAQEVGSREAAYRALEQDQLKSLKCIHSLRAYIESLPPADEVRELKTELAATAARCQAADGRAQQLDEQRVDLRARLQAAQDQNGRLVAELAEIRAQNAALAGQLRGAERRRLASRHLDENDMENVLCDLAAERAETERLGRQVTDFEAAKQQLEEQVRRLSALLEAASGRLREATAERRQVEAGRRGLEAQLAEERSRVERLQSELEAVGEEVRQLRVRELAGTEIGSLFSRISR
jgi:chromosome segregation ATPase